VAACRSGAGDWAWATTTTSGAKLIDALAEIGENAFVPCDKCYAAVTEMNLRLSFAGLYLGARLGSC
jgi:hypothetical protein